MTTQHEPNELRPEDIALGYEVIFPSESEGVTITEDMHNNFTKTTGDINPMHIDNDFAKAKGFNGVLCYGMLTASFYSTLVGVYIPGKYAIFQEADISFQKPVHIGDSLRIKGKVSEINEILKRITIKAEIRNQRNERVSKATLVVGFTE